MKAMKKVLSAVLFCALLFTMAVPGFAADAQTEDEERTEWAERYAYLDLEKASPALKEKILEARRQIIFSTDWVADGHSMWVEDMRTGEIIREIPKFSEVFPGWDLPNEKKMDCEEFQDTNVEVVQVEKQPTARIIMLGGH